MLPVMAPGRGATFWLVAVHRRHNSQPSFSPSGSKLRPVSDRDGSCQVSVVASDVMGADRSDQHRLIDGEDSYRDWSRVGRRVALMRRSCGCSEIHAVKPGSSELTRLKCDGSNKSDPAWSPL
jgi:Tol biopolymer transport system component